MQLFQIVCFGNERAIWMPSEDYKVGRSLQGRSNVPNPNYPKRELLKSENRWSMYLNPIWSNTHMDLTMHDNRAFEEGCCLVAH